MVNGQLAQANAGWQAGDFPGFSPFTVPLGAYLDVQSPWGLLDVAGATNEWTEEVVLTNGIWPTWRTFEGSAWAISTQLADQLAFAGDDFPSLSFFDLGLRVASSVPSPGFSALGIGLIVTLTQRRRRK
jgi:hypothetical protein